MPRIIRANDAYGHELSAYLTEGLSNEIAERDDGFITASDWPKRYFEDFNAWAGHEKQAMRFVLGSRALDVGCGAGRVSLYLQRKGLNVTAIDNSPLAIRLCRRRGVKDARVLAIEQIDRLAARLLRYRCHVRQQLWTVWELQESQATPSTASSPHDSKGGDSGWIAESLPDATRRTPALSAPQSSAGPDGRADSASDTISRHQGAVVRLPARLANGDEGRSRGDRLAAAKDTPR